MPRVIKGTKNASDHTHLPPPISPIAVAAAAATSIPVSAPRSATAAVVPFSVPLKGLSTDFRYAFRYLPPPPTYHEMNDWLCAQKPNERTQQFNMAQFENLTIETLTSRHLEEWDRLHGDGSEQLDDQSENGSRKPIILPSVPTDATKMKTSAGGSTPPHPHPSRPLRTPPQSIITPASGGEGGTDSGENSSHGDGRPAAIPTPHPPPRSRQKKVHDVFSFPSQSSSEPSQPDATPDNPQPPQPELVIVRPSSPAVPLATSANVVHHDPTPSGTVAMQHQGLGTKSPARSPAKSIAPDSTHHPAHSHAVDEAMTDAAPITSTAPTSPTTGPSAGAAACTSPKIQRRTALDEIIIVGDSDSEDEEIKDAPARSSLPLVHEVAREDVQEETEVAIEPTPSPPSTSKEASSSMNSSGGIVLPGSTPSSSATSSSVPPASAPSTRSLPGGLPQLTFEPHSILPSMAQLVDLRTASHHHLLPQSAHFAAMERDMQRMDEEMNKIRQPMRADEDVEMKQAEMTPSEEQPLPQPSQQPPHDLHDQNDVEMSAADPDEKSLPPPSESQDALGMNGTPPLAQREPSYRPLRSAPTLNSTMTHPSLMSSAKPQHQPPPPHEAASIGFAANIASINMHAAPTKQPPMSQLHQQLSSQPQPSQQPQDYHADSSTPLPAPSPPQPSMNATVHTHDLPNASLLLAAPATRVDSSPPHAWQTATSMNLHLTPSPSPPQPPQPSRLPSEVIPQPAASEASTRAALEAPIVPIEPLEASQASSMHLHLSQEKAATTTTPVVPPSEPLQPSIALMDELILTMDESDSLVGDASMPNFDASMSLELTFDQEEDVEVKEEEEEVVSAFPIESPHSIEEVDMVEVTSTPMVTPPTQPSSSKAKEHPVDLTHDELDDHAILVPTPMTPIRKPSITSLPSSTALTQPLQTSTTPTILRSPAAAAATTITSPTVQRSPVTTVITRATAGSMSENESVPSSGRKAGEPPTTVRRQFILSAPDEVCSATPQHAHASMSVSPIKTMSSPVRVGELGTPNKSLNVPNSSSKIDRSPVKGRIVHHMQPKALQFDTDRAGPSSVHGPISTTTIIHAVTTVVEPMESNQPSQPHEPKPLPTTTVAVSSTVASTAPLVDVPVAAAVPVVLPSDVAAVDTWTPCTPVHASASHPLSSYEASQLMPSMAVVNSSLAQPDPNLPHVGLIVDSPSPITIQFQPHPIITQQPETIESKDVSVIEISADPIVPTLPDIPPNELTAILPTPAAAAASTTTLIPAIPATWSRARKPTVQDESIEVVPDAAPKTVVSAPTAPLNVPMPSSESGNKRRGKVFAKQNIGTKHDDEFTTHLPPPPTTLQTRPMQSITAEKPQPISLLTESQFDESQAEESVDPLKRAKLLRLKKLKDKDEHKSAINPAVRAIQMHEPVLDDKSHHTPQGKENSITPAEVVVQPKLTSPRIPLASISPQAPRIASPGQIATTSPSLRPISPAIRSTRITPPPTVTKDSRHSPHTPPSPSPVSKVTYQKHASSKAHHYGSATTILVTEVVLKRTVSPSEHKSKEQVSPGGSRSSTPSPRPRPELKSPASETRTPNKGPTSLTAILEESSSNVSTMFMPIAPPASTPSAPAPLPSKIPSPAMLAAECKEDEIMEDITPITSAPIRDPSSINKSNNGADGTVSMETDSHPIPNSTPSVAETKSATVESTSRPRLVTPPPSAAIPVARSARKRKVSPTPQPPMASDSSVTPSENEAVEPVDTERPVSKRSRRSTTTSATTAALSAVSTIVASSPTPPPATVAVGRSRRAGSSKPVSVFKDLLFILTGLSSHTDDKKAPSQKTMVTNMITEGGGRIVENLNELPPPADSSSTQILVIASEPKRTMKFLFSLARGLPPLDQTWLEACTKEGKLVIPTVAHTVPLKDESGQALPLPRSWIRALKERSFLKPLELDQRPLSGLNLLIVGGSSDSFVPDASVVCREAGAVVWSCTDWYGKIWKEWNDHENTTMNDNSSVSSTSSTPAAPAAATVTTSNRSRRTHGTRLVLPAFDLICTNVSSALTSQMKSVLLGESVNTHITSSLALNATTTRTQKKIQLPPMVSLKWISESLIAQNQIEAEPFILE